MIEIVIKSLMFTIPVELVENPAGLMVPSVPYHVGEVIRIRGTRGRWKIFSCWMRADQTSWWIGAAPTNEPLKEAADTAPTKEVA